MAMSKNGENPRIPENEVEESGVASIPRPPGDIQGRDQADSISSEPSTRLEAQQGVGRGSRDRT